MAAKPLFLLRFITSIRPPLSLIHILIIRELLADGKRMPSAELEKTVNGRGISSRTMRTAKSRIGDRLVTEKDGRAWVCYLRD